MQPLEEPREAKVAAAVEEATAQHAAQDSSMELRRVLRAHGVVVVRRSEIGGCHVCVCSKLHPQFEGSLGTR